MLRYYSNRILLVVPTDVQEDSLTVQVSSVTAF